MSSSAISAAIAKATGNGKPVAVPDPLERQVAAAEFYGHIKPDNPQQDQQPAPKKRGRPPTKSKSPGPPPSAGAADSSTKSSNGPATQKPSNESVQKAVDEMKRASLIAKVRACAQWWPDICGETLRQMNIY